MKKCTKCNRTYSDESLNFCLDDGTVLIADSDAKTVENIQRNTEQQTEILSQDKMTEAFPLDKQTEELSNEQETLVKSNSSQNVSQPTIIKQGVSPLFAYLSVGLLAILVLMGGIGIAFWLNSNAKSDSNATFTLNNTSNKNTSENTLELEGKADRISIDSENKEKPKPKKTPKKEEKPKPTPAETKTPTPKPTETPKEEKGRYFVILGSYKSSANAQKRLKLARSKGLPARIVNTSNVPGLRSGLQAVVIGPFSKTAAQKVLRRAKSVSSDAYVKAG